MRRPWIPITAEALPLPDAPADPESAGYKIKFDQGLFGRVKVTIRDSDKMIVDVLEEPSFQEAYDRVRDLYPQAEWRGMPWHNAKGHE